MQVWEKDRKKETVKEITRSTPRSCYSITFSALRAKQNVGEKSGKGERFNHEGSFSCILYNFPSSRRERLITVRMESAGEAIYALEV